MLTRRLVLIGLAFECLLFLTFFVLKDDLGEVFRYAARYSGRFSFLLYLLAFYWFIQEHTHKITLIKTKKWVTVFSIMHIIHFGFLAASVGLNHLPIVPVKLMGGFLAYVGILCYPFFIGKIRKTAHHLIYFYYVGFVMAMTFLSRIRREFVGADPEVFHFIGLSLVLVSFGLAVVRLYRLKSIWLLFPFSGSKNTLNPFFIR